MALDASFFDGIDIELVKRKFYNANKVNSLLEDIRRQADILNDENSRLKNELGALLSQKAEIAEAVLSTRTLCRDMVEQARLEADTLISKARAEAEALNLQARDEADELVSQAQYQRDAILSENVRQHELAVDKVESCFASMRQIHLDAVEDINRQWQEFLCELYPDENSSPLPEDLPEKLDGLAKQLDDISKIE